MIQFHGVSKSYGAEGRALANVSFQVDKGDFVFITGPSGAGKSTLLRLILRMEVPSAGVLLVGGRNTTRLAAAAVPYLRRSMGVVFQDFKLLPQRTVAENVAISLEVLGMNPGDIRRRTSTMLKQVGLWHRQHVLPARLSGGEQQRVALARALVHEPQVLLADEPTGNLDAARSREIMALLDEANTRGTTVLVATHDHAWVAAADRRVLALEMGALQC